MKIDPALVFHSLRSNFSTAELLTLCQELEIDGTKLGFQDDSLQLDALITLMTKISQQDRISALVNVANRIKPGVMKTQRDEKERIVTTWKPHSLPKELVQKLNVGLEQEGIPYVVCRSWLPDQEGKPRETGCLCWYFDVSEEDMWEFLTLESAHIYFVEKVREMLKNETAVVYVGEHCYGFEAQGQGIGICIVVAPTTDSLDPIRIEQTRSDNYEISTEDLIEELTELDKKFGLDIVAADFGSVTFRIKRILQDEERIDFGYWLHEFAPDAYKADDVINYDIFEEGMRLFWD